jgi:hypothetical protein
MMLDQLLHDELMRTLLGRGSNPRRIYRTRVRVKRNEIFWELMNGR